MISELKYGMPQLCAEGGAEERQLFSADAGTQNDEKICPGVGAGSFPLPKRVMLEVQHFAPLSLSLPSPGIMRLFI